MKANGYRVLTYVVAVASIITGNRVGAQAQEPCKPASPESAAGLASLKKFVVSPDPASVELRKQYHIEKTDPAAVTFVTDAQVCYFAVVAFNAIETSPPAATAVYVYQLGPDMYVVDAAKGAPAKTRTALLFSALWGDIGKLTVSTGK